jgi:hypothetical protein
MSVLDGESEYRISSDKISGAIRSFAITFPGRTPYHLRAVAKDPFNRYFISSWEEGIQFHKLFDTDWRPDLSNIQGVVTAIAISPDARLWALASSDSKVIIGYAPQENSLAFLPIKSLDAQGSIHYLHFLDNNAHLLAIGQNGLNLFYLDWNLTIPQAQGWDKRSELVLSNFMARYHEIHYSELLCTALKKELAFRGMPQLDTNIVMNKLKEAIGKTF